MWCFLDGIKGHIWVCSSSSQVSFFQFSLAICLIVSPSFCISCKNIWQTYEVNIVRGLLAKDRIHQVGILWTAPSAVEWERPLTMARLDWTWFSNIPNVVSLDHFYLVFWAFWILWMRRYFTESPLGRMLLHSFQWTQISWMLTSSSSVCRENCLQ